MDWDLGLGLRALMLNTKPEHQNWEDSGFGHFGFGRVVGFGAEEGSFLNQGPFQGSLL